MGVVGILLIAACSGADGPVGPPGPQGQDGSTRTITLSAVVGTDYRAEAPVPLEVASDSTKPPMMACYKGSNNGANQWYLEAPGSYSCGAIFRDGQWYVFIDNMLQGWTAIWVITY